MAQTNADTERNIHQGARSGAVTTVNGEMTAICGQEPTATVIAYAIPVAAAPGNVPIRDVAMMESAAYSSPMLHSPISI